jgi:hypothetical protein
MRSISPTWVGDALFELLVQLNNLFRPLTQFIKQPRVLDGDDGLRGKIFEKLNLFFSKWSDLLAVDHESANQLFALEHW